MGDCERQRESYERQHQPLGFVDLVTGKNREPKNADDKRMVEIYRVRQLGNPFERPVIEPFSNLLRVGYGKQRRAEQKRNEGKPVRSFRPRIREIVGFADVPKKCENRRDRR